MNSWVRAKITSLYNIVTAPIAATHAALVKRLQSVRDTVSSLYNRSKKRLGYERTLKDVVEEETKKEQTDKDESDEDEDIDLTPKQHEVALNKAFRSFRSLRLPRTDIDTYIMEVTPYIKTLIEDQIKELISAKIQLVMWIMWKYPLHEVGINLTNGNIDYEEDQGFKTGEGGEENVGKKKKVFNSFMTEFFEGSDTEALLSDMFAHIKSQVENPKLPKSGGYTFDHIMHLDIDFHRLVLTGGGSYIKLPDWIANKKAIINPKNNDKECFKWAVIAALHHNEIAKDPQRVNNLQRFIEKYNWEGLKFPLLIQEIGQFEKNNTNIAVNVLFTKKAKD